MAVLVLREAGTEPTSAANIANAGEDYRPINGRPAFIQSSIDWKISDKYVELMHILQTRTFKLNDEEKFFIIKN